jgi:flagellar basal body rod protein FlgG
MDRLAINAASGLRTRMESLDLLANNLANAETLGYKADRESFSLYASPESTGQTTLPVIERNWTDFTQGTLRPTGNQLDLGIYGKGFFAVDGPSGTLYTRNGALRLNAAGVLSTADGYALRKVGGGTFKLDAGKPIEIAADGTVKQDGDELGKIELTAFRDPTGLSKIGKTYYRAAASAGAQPAAAAEIRQGSLEGSNVGIPETAVALIGTMRQFEMLQKAISLGGEMNRKAIQEVAKV